MRVLIGVATCEAYLDRANICRQTWASGVSACDIKFFTGPDLGVADDYCSLPMKTKAICIWALANDYDYLFKCDDDTYIWVDRLLQSGFGDYDYSGMLWIKPSWACLDTYASGGAGYWLSRKAMHLVSETRLLYPANGDGYDELTRHAEDLWVGRLLQAAGIKAHYDFRYAHNRFAEVNSKKLFTIHPCDVDMMERIHAGSL